MVGVAQFRSRTEKSVLHCREVPKVAADVDPNFTCIPVTCVSHSVATMAAMKRVFRVLTPEYADAAVKVSGAGMPE